MPDFTGDGVFCIVSFGRVSGVKLTRFPPFEPFGVVGIDGRAFSRFGLLGLVKEGMPEVFFRLKLGCLRIDFTRSNFPGPGWTTFDSDLGGTLRLPVVEDFGNVRGVLCKLGFEGDRDKVGI